MSTLSKTPDDKMHRYLQRIQKLVGHRAKSPILIKSRNKSPMNAKASRISGELKHEPFLRTIVTVCDSIHRRNIGHFVYNLIELYQVRVTRRRSSHYSEQNYRKTIKQQNDQPLAVRFMVKALHKPVIEIMRQAIEQVRAYQGFIQPQQGSYASRDIQKSLKHRRTYSQIYAESISKYHSKSPAASQRYEYKTPSVQKNTQVHFKRVETRLIFSLLQKFHLKTRKNVFSDIKSFYCTSLSLNITQAKQYLSQIEQKFTSLKNEQQKTVDQLKKANKTIFEQQKTHEMTFSSLDKIKESTLSKNEDDPGFYGSEMERFLNHVKGFLRISEIINRKLLFSYADGMQSIRQVKSVSDHKYARCLVIWNALKSVRNGRMKDFFINLFQCVQKVKSTEKNQNTLMKTESREVIQQRTTKPMHLGQQGARLQSMQSSKHSHSSQKSNTSQFDTIAKKINSAFELKTTLRQRYSVGFQKIDQASFLYMTITNPISKVVQTIKRQSFRKILFYSFFKSQSHQNTQEAKTFEIKPYVDSRQILAKVPTNKSESKRAKKDDQKMFIVLKKLQRKILFMKIQAYSVLKLNNELKQPMKIPEDSVISQVDLKKQIREFLLQRKKMHQKTYETWQKTKQMLQQPSNSSSRSALNSWIKT